jgi:hypothetical protein
MSWQVLAACATGTSHLAVNAPCQDSCIAFVQTDPNDSTKPPLLIIFVADGAGSAVCGGEGAELAIEAATVFFQQSYLQTPEFALTADLAVECVKAVRTKIYEIADENARDYACTFLGVVAFPTDTLLMQIGDGAIVVDVGNGLEVPIVPMTGEYANMTNFVTDEDAIKILQVTSFHARAEKVAVFSDGIQRLALNLAENTAHVPFFKPFFAALAQHNQVQEDSLYAQLAQFLQSPAVNKRTDDDKTLALAHWID